MNLAQLNALPPHEREMQRGAAVWRTSKTQARKHYAKANRLHRAIINLAEMTADELPEGE